MPEMQNKYIETQILGQTTEWMVDREGMGALSDYGILYFGMSEAGGGYRFVRPRPRFSSLFFGISGTGRVLAGKEWHKFIAGDVYISPVGNIHAYESTGEGIWHVAWIALDENNRRVPWFPAGAASVRRADGKGMLAAMERLRQIAAQNDNIMATPWLSVLVAEVEAVSGMHKPEDSRLKKLWQAVADDPGGKWTLAKLSRIATLCPEQTRALCQRYYGQSPMARVGAIRMGVARRLLLRDNADISEIASMVGYSSPQAFGAAFRRHGSATPGEYRRDHCFAPGAKSEILRANFKTPRGIRAKRACRPKG
ncbi:MAG: helix-turn-helix domain-containing protein [Victivallales bacterium]|nr:helix-turn-helix domain-containing protein [Victivallales bacterium]